MNPKSVITCLKRTSLLSEPARSGFIRSLRVFAHFAALGFVGLSVTSCDRSLAEHKQSPAEVCAAAETRNQIEALIRKSDSEGLKALTAAAPSSEPNLQKLLDRFWSSGDVSLQNIRLESVDEVNQRIVCAAQLIVKAPAGSELAKSRSTLIDASVTFFRQPTADAKSFVFGYERQDDISVLPAAMASFLADDQVAGAGALSDETAAPDQTTEVDAPSDGSFDPDGFVNAATCQQAATSFSQQLQCTEVAKREEDEALDRQVSALKATLPIDQRSQLDTSQVGWREKRDQTCEAKADAEARVFETWAAIQNECVFEENKRRKDALRAMAR